MYSLPVFWVAVLLKQFLAIDLNNFLQEPHINWGLVIVLSLVAGVFWMGALGGTWRRRLVVFASAFVVTFGVLAYIFASGWLNAPTIGIPGVAVIGLASAYVFTVLFAGHQEPAGPVLRR